MSYNNQWLARLVRADPSGSLFAPIVQLTRLYFDLAAFKIRTEYDARITRVRETRVDNIVTFEQMSERYDHCESEVEWLESKEKELRLDLARLDGMNSLGMDQINAELEDIWRQRQDFQTEINALKDCLWEIHIEKSKTKKKTEDAVKQLEVERDNTLSAMRQELRMRLYNAI